MPAIPSLAARLAIPAVALAMSGLGAYHVHSESQSLPPSTPPESPSVSPFEASVAVSGLVEPRSEHIAVGSSLPGVVLEVFVLGDRVGALVSAGSPLFRVDDRHLIAQRDAAVARLDAARRRLDRLEQAPRGEEIPPSLARVQTAERRASLAGDKLDRALRLVGRDAVSTEQVVERELEHRIALGELDRVRADHELLLAGAWGPDLDIARAEVAEEMAEVDRLEVEIDRATVRSPIDAVVLRVDVRPGEQVDARPGAPLVVLGDLSALHVRLEIDEEDIPRYVPGSPALAFPRGDADRPYRLAFVRVEPLVMPKRSLTGIGGERVDTRVLQAIYAVEDRDDALHVGQQLDVFINADPSPAPAPTPPARGGSATPASPDPA
jgi:multidrug efflux pump subunit AcrA (membrane-fusion protein)